MAKVERFKARVGGMRQPDSFIVYPKGPSKYLIFQGKRTIGYVDPTTSKGRLNWRGRNSKYFVHLSKYLGAEDVEFPKPFTALVIEFMPGPGDLIGTTPITGPVYVA